jgi:hypothetical protein
LIHKYLLILDGTAEIENGIFRGQLCLCIGETQQAESQGGDAKTDVHAGWVGQKPRHEAKPVVVLMYQTQVDTFRLPETAPLGG